jgi:hypothetical protein
VSSLLLVVLRCCLISAGRLSWMFPRMLGGNFERHDSSTSWTLEPLSGPIFVGVWLLQLLEQAVVLSSGRWCLRPSNRWKFKHHTGT